jgi:ABC-type lipoprotein release transport system permease subunit
VAGVGVPTRWRQAGILLQIAFRNLFASKARTLIVGGIILLGVVVVVVGSSLLDSIDVGMKRSIQGSLGGHVQIYDGRSKDPLALYGGTMGESVLEPIEDFQALKRAVEAVPGVKMVVPMGIDQAMVSMGNLFDVALEKLRGDARLRVAGEGSGDLEPRYQARKAHVRRMVTLLQAELEQGRAITDESTGYYKERAAELADLRRAAGDPFWAGFDRDPLGNLEFLENRVAPLSLDGGFTFVRYVGTDLDAFQKAFPGTEIVEGTAVPRGQRGILLGKLYAEDWLKMRTARRLDKIRDARKIQGRRIGRDEELQRWVKENQTQTRDILLQLDPIRAEEARARLQRALGSREQDLAKLLVELLTTDDRSFDERYRIFYAELAPLVQLYTVKVGDVITIKAPSRSGYMNSVNVKVYGFVQFKGLEKSALAGIMSLMDILSFRDLYGYMTAEKAAEIGRIRAAAGVKAVSRQDAEAELFGGGAEVVTGGRATSFDESRLIARQGPGRGAELFSRVHSQDEIDRGVALNAAVILDDPGRIPQAMAGIEQAARRAGIPKAKVVTWLEASGLVGQSMNLLRLVLYAAVLIIFAVALVIINNAMVMATLQRVKEIGTVRAIGAQRRFVLIMMLVETVATGLAFGALGAAAGLGIVKLIGVAGGIAARNDTMYFLFSGPALVPGIGAMSLAVSLSIVVGVSVLSALYPALIAMRVTPLEAMQSEE